MTSYLARMMTHSSKFQFPDQIILFLTHCKKNFESTFHGLGTRPFTRIAFFEPLRGSPELQNFKIFKILIFLQVFKDGSFQETEKISVSKKKSIRMILYFGPKTLFSGKLPGRKIFQNELLKKRSFSERFIKKYRITEFQIF